MSVMPQKPAVMGLPANLLEFKYFPLCPLHRPVFNSDGSIAGERRDRND